MVVKDPIVPPPVSDQGKEKDAKDDIPEETPDEVQCIVVPAQVGAGAA